MTEFTSVFNALQTRPSTHPNELVYSYANEDGKIEHELNWSQLSAKTNSMTGFLRTECGLNQGDRVLLVYPPSIEFVIAFVGCMRAGLVPVPVYPPNPRKLDSGMEAFHKIAHDCDAQLVLTSEQYERSRNRGGIEELMKQDPTKWKLNLRWVTTDHIEPGSFTAVHGKEPTANDIALIQYTSGSTSAPKGVVITHGNLSHQIEFARVALKLNEHSKAVFWVPQYHDLGLIGGIMNAFAGNVHLTLFSPFSFIKRPALWFDLINEIRATHTAAPNFAFDLVIQKTTPEQRAKWDLSCLTMVMSAAEPVRAQTSQRFLEAFAVSNFNTEAYLPAYGLAEHTVAVTFNGGKIQGFDRAKLENEGCVTPIDIACPSAIELVSSGTAQQDITIEIVDPETLLPCAELTVGEVWVDSPSKAAGYWNMEEENLRSFNASLATIESNGATQFSSHHKFLRTGDLGFMYQGELYICGRLKDMLILAGRNIFPQDIEDSALTIDHDLKPIAMAAFTVDVDKAETTEEKLVLLVDIRNLRSKPEQLEELAHSLQKAILNDHQIPCYEIIIAPIGTVLKTTSGKVRRQSCKKMWLDGSLHEKALYVLKMNKSADVANNAISVTPGLMEGYSREEKMRYIAAEMLNLSSAKEIELDVSLLDQGMSSLTAVEFCQQYEAIAGEELSITQLFNHPSITELCQVLERDTESNETLDSIYFSQPTPIVKQLHSIRHYLQHNRQSRSGFSIGDWSVRAATVNDVPEIHRLDQQEYGWLGEDATDDIDFIRHQVETLNSSSVPWLWLLEKKVATPDGNGPVYQTEVVGWYILQPTHKSPSSIKSWADATDHGKLTRTYDAEGKNLYLVAGGISGKLTKQAHRLMVLNALSLMAINNMQSVFACLAMPGFSEANEISPIDPLEYVALKHANGMPRDAFLAFFSELWPADHRPMRLLENGYPPDQRSGGHGVCACVDVLNHARAIEDVIDKLVQQQTALFGDTLVDAASDSVEFSEVVGA